MPEREIPYMHSEDNQTVFRCTKKKKERELNKRDEPRTKKQKCEKGSQERTLNSQKNSRLFAEKDHE